MEHENIICHVDKTDVIILIFKGIIFARPPSEVIILWLNSNKNFSVPLFCNAASWCIFSKLSWYSYLFILKGKQVKAALKSWFSCRFEAVVLFQTAVVNDQ